MKSMNYSVTSTDDQSISVWMDLKRNYITGEEDPVLDKLWDNPEDDAAFDYLSN